MLFGNSVQTKISGVLKYYSDEHSEKITDYLSIHKES